jgi:GIY-YIG catalytic domain
MPYFVYALIDPRTDVVAYVGISFNATWRFSQHLKCDSTNRAKNAWIQQLQDEGLQPILKILETVETADIARKREKHWINYYATQHMPLRNMKGIGQARLSQATPCSAMKPELSENETSSQSQRYVTSDEGEKLLGVDTGRFFYYVQSGQITREPGSRKRNALYRVSDILQVKEKLSHKQRTRQTVQTPHSFVDWIGIDDVLTSLKLDYRVYGSKVFLADLPYYAARVVRNPHVALAVYNSPKRERILAYISLLPLPEPVILEVLRGERHETKIRTEEIETYERTGGYTLLAEAVVIDPDCPEHLNTLLKHLAEHWCEQYPDRYITKIYAQADSKQGNVIIQKLYFSPREDLAPNAYVLNMARPGASRFVRHLQECIETKRNLQE